MVLPVPPGTQQGDDAAAPRRRRRRKRSNSNREQDQSTQTANVQDIDGNKADVKPADNARKQPEQAAREQQPPQDKVTENTASTPSEQKPVVKPTKPAVQKSAPKENAAQADTAPVKKDNDRLLPWETSVPKKQDKKYKVWSSDSETDQ
jgi:hypothetical protein